MKKIVYLLLIMFLIPIFVNAETLTYDVCESGCEYTDFNEVYPAIDNIPDLSDKDIVININSNYTEVNDCSVGHENNIANSITFNGNNHRFDMQLSLFAKTININDFNTLFYIATIDAEKVNIKNTAITYLLGISYSNDNSQKKLRDILNIDQYSLDNIHQIGFNGNFIIENMSFKNTLISSYMGSLNIYNCELNKIIGIPIAENKEINIYNSKFNSLKYKNIKSLSDEEYTKLNSEYEDFLNGSDSSVLSYDIYDTGNNQYISNTMIYFDKEAKLKPGDKLNLVNYLDYYTEDKEIEYTIEDESVAKIENKELIGLKEGSTNVTVTTDEGHVIYRINLVVEKESLPEKIDKMTIKVPITGSKIKAWIVVVSALLLGIVGVCIGMLVKNKKR